MSTFNTLAAPSREIAKTYSMGVSRRPKATMTLSYPAIGSLTRWPLQSLAAAPDRLLAGHT
jgi:hypothetical protein